MAIMLLFLIPCVLLISYICIRILLWSIEDVAMYCFTTWKGIETFSGFAIGFNIKSVSIIIIHIPTYIIQHASYYNIKHRMDCSQPNTFTLLEYYLYQILYHYLCKQIIFNTMHYILCSIMNKNESKYKQQHDEYNHSTTMRLTTKILSAIIQHIHPFIHFTNDIRVPLKRKDAIQRTHSLSKPSIALVNHNTVSFNIQHIQLENDSNDIDAAIHNMQCLLKFNLRSARSRNHKLFDAQYASITIDQIQINIASQIHASTSDINDESDINDGMNDMQFITKSVIRQFVHILETKVKIHIKSCQICMQITKQNVLSYLRTLSSSNHNKQCLNDIPNECKITFNLDNFQFFHFGINALNKNASNRFAFCKLKYIHYLSAYEQIHLMQLYKTRCNLKCDAIQFKVQDMNYLHIDRLNIEYATDIISLLLSPICGYKLLNAVNIDYIYGALPQLDIKFDLFEININDLLFPNYCALIYYHYLHIASLYRDRSNKSQSFDLNDIHFKEPPHDLPPILATKLDVESRPITIVSPLITHIKCNRIDIKIKLENPFESHLADKNLPLLHIICEELNGNIWLSPKTTIYPSTISYIIGFHSLSIDVPSIFESAESYKHKLSPLHAYKHRLVQFNCGTFSGMKYNEIPLYCNMDQILLQYHPAMTELVAPTVSMVQKINYLLSACASDKDEIKESPIISAADATTECLTGIQIEYNTLHCDVPYYMELMNTKQCKLVDPNVLSLFYFNMKKGTISFQWSAVDFSWIINAINTRFYCEKYNFLNCDRYQLHGFDDFDESKSPKLDITGSDIYGEWDPSLQLKLLSCIMPVIATAINVKYDLYRLHLAPFARYESKEEIEVMKSNLNLRFAFTSIHPKPQSFIGNFEAIKQYFEWYHIDRKPHLQDRFTWTTLHVDNISLILNLCDEFKLNAVVGVFHSDFMPKEIQISDTNLYLLDPAINTIASLEMNDIHNLRVLMMHCDQLIFTRMGVREVLHPKNYDEEHEMMTDYLDVSIYLENKTEIILPYALSARHEPIQWIDILQHKVFPEMCAMLQIWQSMIGLNELSLKRLGPGYECTLNIPSTGFNLEADHLSISILDEYLESFLSQLSPVMMRHLEDISVFNFECVINNKTVNLEQLSGNYIQNVKLYRDTMKPTDALLSVNIKGLVCFAGFLSGNSTSDEGDKYDNFYDINNVFNCMSNLDTSTKLDTDDVKHAFCSLIGRYIWTTINSVHVMLRNFDSPMAIIRNISMNGAIVVVRHDTYPQYLFTDMVSVKHCSNLSGSPLANVSITRSKVPFKLFHDLEIQANKVNIAFCPNYIYALNDLITRIIKFPRIIPELLDEFGSDLAVWDLIRFLFMGRILLNFKHIAIKLLTESKSLSLPSAAIKLNIDLMKATVHNSHTKLSIHAMSVYVDEFNDKNKYSPLVVIPKLIINAGLHWSCHKNKNGHKIEDHWVYPIAADCKHQDAYDHKQDEKQDIQIKHDIFDGFKTDGMTLSLSLKIPKEITVNLYQPLVRSLFSFATSFTKAYKFPVLHSSKKYGYDAYRYKHNKVLKKRSQTQTESTRFTDMFAGIWINYIMIEKISIHLWYQDDSAPSNAITFSLSSLMVSGEFDKIRKCEDINSDSLWKVNVIPNFIEIHHNILYYLENNKISINDIEIRTTRNKTMNATLEELNPMKSTICGHIVICEIYENERRYGLKWRKQLLPTDRAKWSSIDGHPLDKDADFVLPKDWRWVNDWDWKWNTMMMHEDKHKLEYDKNGWQYAFDFHEKRNWSTRPSIHTHARRRRWIRIRRYQQSMDSARDRFKQKDSQPLQFKAEEFIKLSNVCYLQSNEICASSLDTVREEEGVASIMKPFDINEMFCSSRNSPKQRCLDSISKRQKKLSANIHDKKFQRRVSHIEQKYNTMRVDNICSVMQSISSPMSTRSVLSSSNSSNILISPHRGTMRLSNWNQPLITPNFAYPDSAQSTRNNDTSYFESQLIEYEIEEEEKKQIIASEHESDAVHNTQLFNAMDITQFEQQYKGQQALHHNATSSDSSDIAASLTATIEWSNEWEFNSLKDTSCLHSVSFRDLHCVLNRKVRDIVIIISDLYIRSITDLIDMNHRIDTNDTTITQNMDPDDEDEVKQSNNNDDYEDFMETEALEPTPLNSILSYDFEVDKDDDDTEYDESASTQTQTQHHHLMSPLHTYIDPITSHCVEVSPSASRTTLSGDGILEESTAAYESPLSRHRRSRASNQMHRFHVAPSSCIEEQKMFDSNGLIEIPFAMIQIINTQFNLESVEKRACCVSGLGSISVRIDSFWNLCATKQEAMRVKIECRELDSWVAPTDVDPDMRPWIKRRAINKRRVNDIDYAPTAAMRNKQRKKKEQSILQLIMHPIAVDTQIIMRNTCDINISICAVELSLNDHQFHNLIGIIQSVILPTSPVAVEYLTKQLEIQHNNDQNNYYKVDDMQNIMELRARLISDIHEIEFMLRSQYAQFVRSNNILVHVEDEFYHCLNEKEKELKRKQLRLHDLERKWSIILAISKVKAAENEPLDEKLTNLFLNLTVENFRFETFLFNNEPFLSVVMDGFVVQIKEIEDLSGSVAIEIDNISIYNLLAIKDPAYHSWKDIIAPWNMTHIADTNITQQEEEEQREKVMISIQIKHEYKNGFREIRNAEFNIAPLRIQITMDVIDTMIEFIFGKNLEKQKKARRKETKKAVSSHIQSGTNIHQTISTKQKIKNSLSNTAKKMMLKQQNNSGASSRDNSLGKYKQIDFELEMKEEYQLITQFRNHAQLIIKKQTEFIKIWRLRVGPIYLLVNFIKGQSTNNAYNFALPSVFDMKLKIKPKTYNATTNKQALEIMNHIKKSYLKMLITKLPNTYLKHSFAQMFFHNDHTVDTDHIGENDDHEDNNDEDINGNQDKDVESNKKKKRKYRLKALTKSRSKDRPKSMD